MEALDEPKLPCPGCWLSNILERGIPNVIEEDIHKIELFETRSLKISQAWAEKAG
jgi:hypothetical protein